MKSIFELYESNAGINHTTRSNTSYKYAPMEYGSSRQEQQEQQENKTNIVQKLQKCVELSKTGRQDAYARILLDINNIKKEVENILSSH